MNEKAFARFKEYIAKNFDNLQTWLSQMGVHIESQDEFINLFEWAWMNVATRCFGHPQLPNEIAMCPLMDLLNHQSE